MPNLQLGGRIRRSLIATTAMVLLAPAAAQASLEWSSQPYQRISQAQTNGDLTRVGADAQGNAVLAWREADSGRNRVRIATRTPGGYFSRVEFPGGGFASDSDRDASRPRVAVAADGSAIATWEKLVSVNMTLVPTVEGRYRSKLGAWGPVEALAQGQGVRASDVAIDPNGNVTVAYIQNFDIKARYRAANGTYESPATVYTQSQAQPSPVLFDPLVAMDAAGNVLVSWADAPTSTVSDPYGREVRSAQRPAGGAWESDKLLTTRQSFENIVIPTDVAIHDGTAVVMVARTSPVEEAYTRPAGQANFAQHKFYEYGSYGTDPGGVVFDAGGNALVVFASRYANGSKAVASAYRPAGGDWGPVTDIPGTSDRFHVYAPGVDSAGNFTAAWTVGADGGTQQLLAATRPPGAGAAFDAPQVISEPRPAGEPGGPIESPGLAVSGQGQAVAAWSHTDGEALRVEAGFGNVPPTVFVPPPFIPVQPPPPPPPPTLSAISAARPLASGQATVLTLDVSGDVTRLDWKVADSPTVSGRVVNGALQKSIRVRTPSGNWKVTVTATGPGGTKTFTRSFNGARNPTDDAARRVKISSGAADVIAVGNANVLTGKTSGCGELTIYAKSQHYSGCFKPIEEVDDIPAAERGVLSPLANAVDVSPSDAVTVGRAVELTDGYVASGPMLINGRWSVVPRGSAKLVSYPQAKVLASSNAGVRIGGRLFTPPGSGFALTLDPASGQRIDLGTLPAPDGLTIGGFGFQGDLKVTLSTLEADIQGNMRLPSFIQPASMGTTDFWIVVPIRFRAGPDDLRGLDGLTVGPMKADVQLTPMTDLKLTYSQTSGTWTGGGTACLLGVLACAGLNACKADIGCLDLQPPYGGLRIRGEKLEYMGVSRAFSAPGKLVAPGSFLERIDVGIKENPARFLGGARIGVGPFVKVDGKAVIAFPSDRAPWYPSRDELRNLPEKVYRTPFTNIAYGASADVILPLPIIGETRLGGGYLLYEFPGYVTAGGGSDFSVGPVHMLGLISGEYDISTLTYNLHGDIRSCLGTKICAGAIGNVSRGPNNAGGAGACIAVGPVNVGGGIQWVHPDKPLVWPFDGCKWSRFKLDVRPRVRAAQATGTTTIEVKQGEPSPAVQLTGAGAAPRVRVSGPTGTLESTDKGLDYTPDGKIRIIRYEENGTNITVVGLQDAKPGTYKVETLPGSAPITQVMRAADTPDAKVTAKVSGTGSTRTLTYDVAPRSGQKLTFRDVTGGNAGKALRTISGGKGKVTWSPAPGRVAHTIVASFELDGIPAEQRTVARFKPPPPTLAKPIGLKAKRGKKSKLFVSWRRVRDATRYQVTVLTTSGRTVTKLVRSTKVTLSGIAASTSGKVAVVPLSPLRQGKAATKSFKRTARANTKFGGLKKCKKVSKRKLVCR